MPPPCFIHKFYSHNSCPCVVHQTKQSNSCTPQHSILDLLLVKPISVMKGRNLIALPSNLMDDVFHLPTMVRNRNLSELFLEVPDTSRT